MVKDGKHWFGPRQQQEMAERLAAERSKLKTRAQSLAGENPG
jgi:hypothetical protein